MPYDTKTKAAIDNSARSLLGIALMMDLLNASVFANAMLINQQDSLKLAKDRLAEIEARGLDQSPTADDYRTFVSMAERGLTVIEAVCAQFETDWEEAVVLGERIEARMAQAERTHFHG